MHRAVTFREAAAADLSVMEALLIAAELSLEGVQAHLADFVLAIQGNEVVGVAGLERYGPHALLRSVAVRADHQGRGLGQSLTRATEAGLETLTLLTTTAANFFPKLGFRPVTRDALPAALQASSQLRGICSASATVMHLTLRHGRPE
ncbi:arsenic resistance N-acetyltransferase ArsN2 [Deinococcus soli (ex Cha et al. 2016)]|uniref:Amino-acid N-acetyltransferase n=2 Tax=Deinococcus soli (ex Cha et al. 2016) TaxID=1309411 RepID=A0ACC6KPQ6_9DEIO|nr:arsenic resistance N-acetyltransferase ArsN2 [Deinococcus soli (ex Cha et al. 2016)]MDR6221479.1 amino-acid N-acetyltransferase [Deinococcus soli (ex Cha et al. 2016)]MDR6331472.1 amino-acid N-acetyltransferase [Deinococcus soli (ex Cha et al. 2016)]MDR6754639.1 amino-acid N-acetyltransferase [Deinococcus soli (ex Cha et al. 2016)]